MLQSGSVLFNLLELLIVFLCELLCASHLHRERLFGGERGLFPLHLKDGRRAQVVRQGSPQPALIGHDKALPNNSQSDVSDALQEPYRRLTVGFCNRWWPGCLKCRI